MNNFIHLQLMKLIIIPLVNFSAYVLDLYHKELIKSKVILQVIYNEEKS